MVDLRFAVLLLAIGAAVAQLSTAQASALDGLLQALGCSKNSSACPSIAQLQADCTATAGTSLRLQCNNSMVEHLNAGSLGVLAGGSISSHIGVLSALTYLNVVRNRLTSIHTSIGRLSKLQDLALYENVLSILPDEISGLTSLTYLSARANQLVGTVPSVARLTLLVTLALSDNPLLSGLPAGLSRLTALTYLSFRDTSVGGSFPDLTRLSRLREVHFFNTSLSGAPKLPNTPTLEECRLNSTCLLCTGLPSICECSPRAAPCDLNPTPIVVTGAPGSGVPGSGVPGSGVPGSAVPVTGTSGSVPATSSLSVTSAASTSDVASNATSLLETSLRVVVVSPTLSPGDNAPAIAGAVGGALLACLLLALIVFVTCRARKNKSRPVESLDSEVTAYSLAPETIDIAPVPRYGHSPVTSEIAHVERYGQLPLKRNSNNYDSGRVAV